MSNEARFEITVSEFLDTFIQNPSAPSFPLVCYPFAFRVPLIIAASLLIWALLISGIQGNAARQQARQPSPSFHAMSLMRAA